MELTKTSLKRFTGVHPDLVRVIQRTAKDWADKEVSFIVTCGLRTLEEQKVYVAKGFSKTMRSKHLPQKDGMSHAVDLAILLKGKLTWDWPAYKRLADRVKAAAKAEQVAIVWGGDWVTFKDGPHFQLTS